jgi:hydrogenase maturation protease
MARLSVIGVGSPFGDDQAGWYVADALAASSKVAAYGERVAVTSCRSPGGDLPELLTNSDVAIVVDAVIDNGAAGTVYRIEGHRLPAFVAGALSSHGITLQTILEISDALQNRPKALIVYGIEAQVSGTGSAMSESMCRAAARVVEHIKRDITHYCGR